MSALTCTTSTASSYAACSMMTRYGWAVAQVEASRERYAVHELHRQGFTTWLPECEVRLSHARMIIYERRPLFPSYLFVDIDITTPWRSVSGTRGVRHLILRDDKPAVLPRHAAEAIQTRCKADGGAIRLYREIKPGDIMQIATGDEFDGLFGPVVSSSASRVTLLLDIVGGRRKVSLDLGRVLHFSNHPA